MQALFLASVLFASSSLATEGKPVRVGLNGPDLDGCISNGRVVGLKARGDNFLSVRASPSIKAKAVDKLSMGETVIVCDSAANGQWLGVVYAIGDEDDCAVNSPVAVARNYEGPCLSGWVSAKFIEIYAG